MVKRFSPEGTIYFLQLWGCEKKEFLVRESLLKELCLKADSLGFFNIMRADSQPALMSHRFNPGISVTALIGESSISLHTWPEFEYVDILLHTCSPIDLVALESFFLQELRPETYHGRVLTKVKDALKVRNVFKKPL